MIRNAANETNYPHRLMLTNEQASNVRKYFTYNSSANMNLSKTKLFKII